VIVIGVTGTQRGCAAPQLATAMTWLDQCRAWGADIMANGDCVGADEQLGKWWLEIGGLIYLHPPSNTSKRAFLRHAWAAEPAPYLERNRAIVVDSSFLLATPGEREEQLRSGTWATIRYARKARLPIVIVFPDGTITKERF